MKKGHSKPAGFPVCVDCGRSWNPTQLDLVGRCAECGGGNPYPRGSLAARQHSAREAREAATVRREAPSFGCGHIRPAGWIAADGEDCAECEALTCVECGADEKASGSDICAACAAELEETDRLFENGGRGVAPDLSGCRGRFSNGPDKRYAVCGACGRVDHEANENDRCGEPGARRRDPAAAREVRPDRPLVLLVDSIEKARALAGVLVSFRAPHHTAPRAALVEELRLAAGGVLYLDEPGSFERGGVDTLARTIERGGPLPRAVVVNTAGWAGVTLPAGSRRYAERVRAVVAQLRAACGEGLSAAEYHTNSAGARAGIQARREAADLERISVLLDPCRADWTAGGSKPCGNPAELTLGGVRCCAECFHEADETTHPDPADWPRVE